MSAGGLLLVDKPTGPTSFAAVARVRKLCGERRVGHAGTLDPLASGMLPVLVGEATKLVPFLVGLEKVYEAEVRLGVATDTYDAEGRVTARADASGVGESDLRALLPRFVGQVRQRPPLYSAIKKDGQRLYELARADVAHTPEERTVEIHSIALERFEAPVATLRVRCGKGTYIRSIAHDLGAALGVGAHLAALRRTRVGSFDVADAFDPFAADARPPLRPLAAAVAHLPAIAIDADAAARLHRGQQACLAALAAPADAGAVRLLLDGALVAVAERDAASGGLVLARVFH